MDDRERDEDQGALPPGEPPQTDPPNDPAEPAELPESAQEDDAAPGQIELDDPSSDAVASPGQDAAAEAHRRFSEFGKAYLAEIERQRTGASSDAESIPWHEAMLPDRQAPTEQQQPTREIRDFFQRPEDEAAGRLEKLPGIRPIHGATPPKIQLLSDADGKDTSPADSVEPPSNTVPETASEAPPVSTQASNVPPQAYAAPPASRSVRLPFPGESRDDTPDTLEGLVELHERQMAGPASSSGAPSPTSPPEEQPPANEDRSPADKVPSTSLGDAELHAMPQVPVTVSLIDAERLVSEEFRSMADEHADAMRQIASEELDEYNFKIMAELRAVFGR